MVGWGSHQSHNGTIFKTRPPRRFPAKVFPIKEVQNVIGRGCPVVLPQLHCLTFSERQLPFGAARLYRKHVLEGTRAGTRESIAGLRGKDFLCFPLGAACTFFFFFFCVIHMVKNQRLAEEAQPPGPFRTANAEEPGRPQESRVAEEPREAGEPGRTRGHRTPKKPGKPWDPRRAENHSSSLRSRVVLGRLE